MTNSISVHLDKKEEYEVSVKHSLFGAVSISLRYLDIFCTPEQAMKLASDILQGVLSLPKLTEAEQAEKVKEFEESWNKKEDKPDEAV